MHTIQSVLLIGATGAFGVSLCQSLALVNNKFRRMAILHDVSRPTGSAKQGILNSLEDQGFEIVTANGYGSVETYRNFDCIVSLLGNHALSKQPAIFERAIQAGVQHIYPSEYGADLLVGQNWTQRYYKYKTKTREFLEEKGNEQGFEGLGWTYFTLGRLTEWAVLSHFGVDNEEASARIYGTKEGRQSLLGVTNSADYIVATLLDPLPDVGEDAGTSKGRRRTYRISGESPSWSEIFDALQRITGRAYKVTYLDVESAQMEEAKAKGDGDVDRELAASHKLIQGRQGTLLPRPWDNNRFPQVRVEGFEEVLAAAFKNKYYRKLYGVE